jgi:hypothetical protein
MARVLTGYSDLNAAANIAHELVQGPHARIKEIEIRFVESTEKGSGKGCGSYARIRMRDLLNRWIEAIALDEVGDDAETAWQKTAPVVIEFYREQWDNLTSSQQRALVDHMLAHLAIDKGKLKVIQHTVGEFVGVRQRNGDWLPILAEFTKGVQPPLDLAPPAANGSADREEDGAERAERAGLRPAPSSAVGAKA